MNEIIAINRQYLTFDVDWHSHDYLEIIYCTKGTGRIELKNGKTIHYKKNEFAIISPGAVHRNVSETGFENIYLMSSHNRLSLEDCVVTTDTPNRSVYSIMSQAFYFFNSYDFSSYDLMSMLSDLLFGVIVTIDKSLRFSEKIEYMRSEIIRKFSNPNFKIKDILIDDFAITESDQKQFRKEMGMTPLQFLTNTRIDNAKKLLARRESLNMNITEIAKSCGFEDVLYFSRVFKQHCGVSPMNYNDRTETQGLRSE